MYLMAFESFCHFWAERTKLVPFPESTPQHTVDDLAQRLSNIIDFAKGDFVGTPTPVYPLKTQGKLR